jgi:hypothetical protein
VGFNDKSEERKGYVCIGCTKAFKDVSYLEKHLVAKHPDLAEVLFSLILEHPKRVGLKAGAVQAEEGSGE